jgi:hypothetical protein
LSQESAQWQRKTIEISEKQSRLGVPSPAPLSLLCSPHGAGAPTTGGRNSMPTQSKGPSTGFSWVGDGVSVGFRHPKPLFGGAALMMLVTLIPVLIMLIVQFHYLRLGAPPPPTATLWIMGLSIPLNLLLVPLQAGYLQVIDAAECDQPARARDIFQPYLKGQAPRLIGYGLTVVLIYFVLLAVIGLTTGGSLLGWQSQMLAAQINHQPPTLPKNFWLLMSSFPLIFLLMLGFFAISLGQVSLSNRSVFGAIGDGIIGTLKNVLPLLVFSISAILLGLAIALGFGIVAAVLALIGKLIGAWLLVLIVPLYIALILTLFTASYGVVYHLWLDVCGTNSAPGAAEPIAA